MNAAERFARGGMVEGLRASSVRLNRIVEGAIRRDGIVSSRDLRALAATLEGLAVKQGELRALLLGEEE